MTDPSRYLLALYVVEHRQDPPVAPGRVADHLDRTAGTAVEMCHRLDERGLVRYEPYEGVTLTEAGRRRAAELHETYVTLSWFFRHVLDLDDHEAEAMELAGTVSGDVVDRLVGLLSAAGPPGAESPEALGVRDERGRERRGEDQNGGE